MKIIYFLLLSSIASANLLAQNIGIGTSNPTQKLHINGAIRIGNAPTADTGTIRFNTTTRDFEGNNGERWMSLTAGKSGWGNNELYSTESGGIMAPNSTDTSYGEPISLSGERLAVAIPRDENGIYKQSGSVNVMKLYSNGQVGNHSVIYSPTIGNYYQFGASVSVNGSQLAIGEPGALKDGNTQQGRAYVYKLDNQNQEGAPFELLQTAGDPFDKFGSTVAISGDYVAVAATEKAVAGNIKQGRVYAFRRLYILGEPTDGFIAESNFTATDGMANMKFGAAISLQPGIMVIGAPGTTVGGDVNAGKVYIYRRINNAWQFEASLTSPNPIPNDNFGKSVCVNITGDTLIVGMPSEIGGGDAFMYVKNGANWQYSYLFQGQSGGLHDGFGSSVDFKDGRVLIGARAATVGINYHQGKAYLFSRSGISWTREALFTAQNGEAYLEFGASVQLGTDVAIVSAPGYANSNFHADKGRIYWFLK